MRDCYSIKLGDGMMEHHDYGFVTYQRYGEWYERCEECDDLAPEDYTSNHDGLCDTCYRQKHACDYCGDFSLDLEDFDGDKLCPECRAKQERKVRMNERLDELTKQIQDAIAEIGTILPVIRITDLDNAICFLLSDEKDIADNFPGYFRVPLPRGSDCFNSEVYVTLNGMKFHTYSELEAPAGFDKVYVANPERMAR